MTTLTALTDDQLIEARAIARRAAARCLPNDPEEAEDVAQSVLMKLLDTDPAALANWRAWVTRVARNLAIDHVRRRRVIDGFEIDQDAPPRGLIARGPSAAGLWRLTWADLTRSLTEQERAMLLASLDGATNADIAADFGYANANSAAVVLSRIRAKVRAQHGDRARVRVLLGG